MQFHFQTGDVTFFEEDKEYFEKRLQPLKKFLGSTLDTADKNAINLTIKIAKNKHSSGNRFESSATMICPLHGTFHAETEAENIKKCADGLQDSLKKQIRRAKEKMGHSL
ncbi:HPF/RaiA family ribosome-associated protein [bacterium]|jgi:ribosomal subunit interface protein|nr:HPF/RaiA family ribosome-associated protein [bacterium]MBT6831794.1 HPF/RaiA family ribosome-associated protein [bacterium]MBT6996001.1 HPF/RaiA family ribosome-associated protein [bacterium]MBT7772628.1 HPF/RaiA family ribosome-associated protein [bacterium]